jgi:deazaflavin-dependent oxidoreductase (nitroreductase family)
MTDPISLANERYCYLTTRGRTTGEPRRIEIWFSLSGRTIYILAGDGPEANWVKNAVKTPDVIIEIRNRTFTARARAVGDQAEDVLARRPLCAKYADDEWASTSRSLADWAQAALPMAFDLT